jgi:cytolysin-activating lysine-acyltransferase
MTNTATNKGVAGKTTRRTAAKRQAQEATLRVAALGEIMSVLLQSPRHRRVTLGTLARQMVPAYLTNQFVLARAKSKNGEASATPVGVAFWASVSDEVDKRLSSDPKGPIELSDNEWQSGSIIWLLDVVAAPKVGAALVKSIREKVGSDKTIKIRTADTEGRPIIKAIK